MATLTTRSLAAVALAVLLTTPSLARAQALDPASEQALRETLRLLLDPSLRNPELAKNPQAAEIDKQIRSLAGSDKLTQEFYELAAQIFTELTRNSGGDPARMSEALEAGKKDPAAFAAMLSPATLERLRDLAVKITDQPRR